MMELLTGVIVAVAVVALVIEPLFIRRTPRGAAPTGEVELDFTDPEESESPRVRALLALKEIEFDRATGKLSEEDYAILKRQYGKAALEAMEAEGISEAVTDPNDVDDAVERVIAQARTRGPRSCPDCGDRPEPAAVYCSSCGRALDRPDARPRCWECGADLEVNARFCGACGVGLTA